MLFHCNSPSETVTGIIHSLTITPSQKITPSLFRYRPQIADTKSDIKHSLSTLSLKTRVEFKGIGKSRLNPHFGLASKIGRILIELSSALTDAH
jgi:hypothetical protein